MTGSPRQGALVNGKAVKGVVGVPADDRGRPQGVLRGVLRDVQLDFQLLVFLLGVLVVHQLLPQGGVFLGEAVHHLLELVPGEGVQVHELRHRAGDLGAHALHGGGDKAQQARHHRAPRRGGIDEQAQKHHHYNDQHLKGAGFEKILQVRALLFWISH